MNNDDWPSELKSFYDGLSLSEDRKDRILQMREVLLEARRWKRIAALLAASAVLMLATSIYNFAKQPGAAELPQNVASRDNDGQGSSAETSVVGSTRPDGPGQDRDRSEIRFELVAVKVNHDQCPQCKKMGNVFAELQQDLKGRPILFLTFDMSDSVQHEQSILFSEALGISGALENNKETGMIVLIDPRGQMLEQLDGTAGRQYLANRIEMQLDKS